MSVVRTIRPRPRIPFTKEGYEATKAEFEQLKGQRPEAVEDLRKAREMGDLSENGYYKAARSKLSGIDARLRHLERILRYGVIAPSPSADMVEIGTSVTVNDGIRTQTWKIVGGYESDPKAHTISNVSPLGRALMGRKKGEKVRVHVPIGDIEYTILDIGVDV